MLKRDEWLDLSRKLDWNFSYVDERDVFPPIVSGSPWLPHEEWQGWDEPYRTSYSDYVATQHKKEQSVRAAHEAIGGIENSGLDTGWMSGLKLHAATLPLAEFTAVIGNLRAARFGRDSAWRNAALLGALDELRHTQIPLKLMHNLVRQDRGFDWTHRLMHSDNWVGIAGRHLCDELLLMSDPIEFAVATHFVFETGFTNLQFVGLSSLAHRVGDSVFERMVQSIQTDEARHAQIGRPVLETVVRHDPAYAQRLIDKWFWRSWQFFAVVTGFAMDYLTPLQSRTASFKEFVQEWVLEQFQRALDDVGLKCPWYWETFLRALDNYHHMVYASAYTYRATVWFDFHLPGPAERDWLSQKYPHSWAMYEPIWQHLEQRWQAAGPEVEWNTHGLTPIGFCNTCQLVLSGGTPERNTAQTHSHDGKRYIFCSEPCAWIFKADPHRYAAHEDVVKRILTGKLPANLLELLQRFGLTRHTWGKDIQKRRECAVSSPPPPSSNRVLITEE
jgi:toluene monooxygenase system protein A